MLAVDDEQERRARLLRAAETDSPRRAARPAAHCSLGREGAVAFGVLPSAGRAIG